MSFKMKGPSFFKESIKGYKKGSPDINEPKLKIPSNEITMKGVEFPVHGKDNLGNEKIMRPGKNYKFPGDYVIETPMKQKKSSIYWYKIDGKPVTKKQYNAYKNIPGKMEGGGKTTNDPDPAGIKAKHRADREKLRKKKKPTPLKQEQTADFMGSEGGGGPTPTEGDLLKERLKKKIKDSGSKQGHAWGNLRI